MLPEGEEDDEKRNAQLAELPEGLRAVAGDARELAVRSSRLAVVPVWVGELTLRELNELQEMPDLIGLTALGSLTIQCCGKLRALPRGIGKLGALRGANASLVA